MTPRSASVLVDILASLAAILAARELTAVIRVLLLTFHHLEVVTPPIILQT